MRLDHQLDGTNRMDRTARVRVADFRVWPDERRIYARSGNGVDWEDGRVKR